MNEFQRTLIENYEGGEFDHVKDRHHAGQVGDTLFAFLFVELSTEEGCEDREAALQRMETAQTQLADVFEAIEETGHE